MGPRAWETGNPNCAMHCNEHNGYCTIFCPGPEKHAELVRAIVYHDESLAKVPTIDEIIRPMNCGEVIPIESLAKLPTIVIEHVLILQEKTLVNTAAAAAPITQ